MKLRGAGYQKASEEAERILFIFWRIRETGWCASWEEEGYIEAKTGVFDESREGEGIDSRIGDWEWKSTLAYTMNTLQMSQSRQLISSKAPYPLAVYIS